MTAEEIHLIDLIRGGNISWQARAAYTEELYKLRTKEAKARGEDIPSIRTLAIELRGTSGGSYNRTRREILVAPHLGDPKVFQAKNVDDAFKLLKDQEDDQRG